MAWRNVSLKSTYVLVSFLLCIPIVGLLIVSASANVVLAAKDGADNSQPCHDVIFETSWQQVASDLLDVAIPRVCELTEDEYLRSVLKESYLTTGPSVVIDIILEGGLREPLECISPECRGAAKLVVFKYYLEFLNDEFLCGIASETQGEMKDGEVASDNMWGNDIHIMQKIQTELSCLLSPEVLAKFNECLRQTFEKNEAASTRALFHIKDTDKILSEDEISKISEAVGEEYSKVWLQQVLCPTVDYEKLKRDARKKVTADCRGKVSDTGWSIAERLLFEDDESKNDSK